MARKGENIYKRKDGRWEGRFAKERGADGRIRYGSVYAKTYREVKKKQMVEIYRVSEGKPANVAEDGDVRFRDEAKAWFCEALPGIKESTAVKYRNLLQWYILPELGNLPLSLIDVGCVQAYCNKMLSSGGKDKSGLSEKTTADTLSVIRSILRRAASQGRCEGRDFSAVRIKQPRREMRVLSPAEQKRLTCYLYTHRDVRNLGILISLYMGLRIGEVCALRWEDVSFADQTLYVHRTMQRIQAMRPEGEKTKVMVTPPKSGCSIRRIPLPENLLRLAASYYHGQSGYVLTNSDTRYIEPRSMENHFKKVMKLNGIDRVTYHTMRHTFATRCVEQGFDVKSLSEILGHASVSITMNRYVHPSMELKRENMERLAGLLTASQI